MKELTQEFLKSIISYDEVTGIFRWRSKPAKRIAVGSVAGHLSVLGYVVIGCECESYKAHRLAWLYVYGVNPPQEIDHINGVKNDNRIANLRLASPRSNSQNQVRHRLGRLPGACFIGRRKKWEARIKIHGKQTYIGRFGTEQEASSAYFRVARELEAAI